MDIFHPISVCGGDNKVVKGIARLVALFNGDLVQDRVGQGAFCAVLRIGESVSNGRPHGIKSYRLVVGGREFAYALFVRKYRFSVFTRCPTRKLIIVLVEGVSRELPFFVVGQIAYILHIPLAAVRVKLHVVADGVPKRGEGQIFLHLGGLDVINGILVLIHPIIKDVARSFGVFQRKGIIPRKEGRNAVRIGHVITRIVSDMVFVIGYQGGFCRYLHVFGGHYKAVVFIVGKVIAVLNEGGIIAVMLLLPRADVQGRKIVICMTRENHRQFFVTISITILAELGTVASHHVKLFQRVTRIDLKGVGTGRKAGGYRHVSISYREVSRIATAV